MAAAHRTRQATSTLEAREALVELLTDHIARAYVTAGEPGVFATVRDLFRRMDDPALTALVYELGLAEEPPREEEPEAPRP